MARFKIIVIIEEIIKYIFVCISQYVSIRVLVYNILYFNEKLWELKATGSSSSTLLYSTSILILRKKWA